MREPGAVVSSPFAEHSGVYTNSVVGHISANTIGSTETLSSPPATATTRIGSPDLTLTKADTGSYTLNVTNVGVAASSGPITVTDVLPTGLSYSGFSGAGWACSASGQLVICETTATLLPGEASAVVLSVNVAANAPPSLENTATVSGGGVVNGGNNSGSVTTPTVDAGRIVLSKTVRNVTKDEATPGETLPSTSGTGKPGDVLEYCVVYENVGGGRVTGTVMHDPVPTYTAARTAVGDYADQAARDLPGGNLHRPERRRRHRFR